MIIIDGAEGEGGGQVLRTALALSLITGQPFQIVNIRANRSRAGLMRQHMTALEAACAIGGTCDEVELGASKMSFTPGAATPGDYTFSVGTAGSTSLVLQTILFPLLLAGGPSRIVLEGGTHNIYAPPFDFIDRAYLPLLRRMGAKVHAELKRPGFYPAGGGRIEVEIGATDRLRPLELVERGALLRVDAHATVSALPGDIAVRELAAVERILGWPEEARRIVRLPERTGPGNILVLEAEFENVTEVTSGFGKLGVSADVIGKQTARRMAGYLESTAAVGPYLADQLLLPVALASGGTFTTVKPTQHSQTAAAVIEKFLPVEVRFEVGRGHHLVSVESR